MEDAITSTTPGLEVASVQCQIERYLTRGIMATPFYHLFCPFRFVRLVRCVVFLADAPMPITIPAATDAAVPSGDMPPFVPYTKPTR